MKINLPENYKTTYTLFDLECAKATIQSFKDDTSKPVDYALTGLTVIADKLDSFVDEILTVKATTEVNFNLEYDRIAENTGRFDVKLSGYAKLDFRRIIYYEMYITDIWDLCSDIPSTRDTLYNNSLIIEFKKV